MRRLGLVLIASLALLVSAPAEGATPLTRQTVPGLGLSIGVPAGWKAFAFRKVTDSAAVQKLGRENPNLAQLFAAIRDPRSGVRFFAADTQTPGRFATNLNVVVEKVPSGTTPAAYADAASRQLETLPVLIRPIVKTPVQLPVGPAVRLRYGLRFTFDGKQASVRTTQYAFVHGTHAIIVTYTTLPARLDALAPLFALSARSIRLG